MPFLEFFWGHRQNLVERVPLMEGTPRKELGRIYHYEMRKGVVFLLEKLGIVLSS